MLPGCFQHMHFFSCLSQPFLLCRYPINHSTNIAHWVAVAKAEIWTENLTLNNGPCCISRGYGHSNSQVKDLETSLLLFFTNLGRDSYKKWIGCSVTIPGTSISERQSHVESWHFFFSTDMVHLQLPFPKSSFAQNFPLIFSYPPILFVHNSHIITSSWITIMLWHRYSIGDLCNTNNF